MGRATVFLMGLAVILALVLGVASAAFADNGSDFLLWQTNVATLITRLAGPNGVNGAMFEIQNNNAGTDDTALSLKVQPGEPPMKVNSTKQVAHLNADKVDGVSIACPSGTLFHEGVCIEQNLRSTSASFATAQADCLDEAGTRPPTPSELQTLEGRTEREWSNHAYTDFGTNNFDVDIMVEANGTLGTYQQGGLAAYRCVKQPN